MAASLSSNGTWSGNLTDNTTVKIPEHPVSFTSTQDLHISTLQREENSLIGHETSLSIQWIFALIIIPCISLPGILGNMSSMIVLHRHGFKKTSNILLAALTLADAFYLIGINNVPAYIHDYSSSPGFAYSTTVCYVLYGLYRLFFLLELWGNWCSLTLPVLITLERIVAVYSPFKFPIIVTPRRTWTAVIAIFILWVPVNVYYFFLDDLVFVDIDGHSHGVITRTRLYTDDNYKQIYVFINRTAIILTEPISVLLVIVGCIMVGVKIKAASVKRRKMMSAVISVTQKPAAIPSSRTTWTLMLVCIVYTITIGSAFFIQLTVTPSRNTQVDKILDTMVRFVKCLHSSCNFFIYIYANRNFRDTYRHIFGNLGSRSKRPQQAGSNRSS
ncbi:unnamed protein product [Candidula unifasciata]|uniref:G-protein coupled receptors family 1 profile domain-containing protein n=1 Tax=Candidula unifasciata TaxID=100452 RepID=A0A8S3YYW0_9EUPU|nr:unnamed protein product [Candidula unifasciata]